MRGGLFFSECDSWFCLALFELINNNVIFVDTVAKLQ